MTDETQVAFEKLGDTGLVLADGEVDVRGRMVVDSAGEELGKVDGLFVDLGERRVRLLEISDGGLLGFGGTTRLVPVEAVSAVEEERITVSAHRQSVSGSPVYDPELADRPEYFRRRLRTLRDRPVLDVRLPATRPPLRLTCVRPHCVRSETEVGMTPLRALALSCSLKRSPSKSSSELIGRELLAALADHDVEGELVRVSDHDVRFGVSLMGTSGRRCGRRRWLRIS